MAATLCLYHLKWHTVTAFVSVPCHIIYTYIQYLSVYSIYTYIQYLSVYSIDGLSVYFIQTFCCFINLSFRQPNFKLQENAKTKGCMEYTVQMHAWNCRS